MSASKTIPTRQILSCKICGEMFVHFSRKIGAKMYCERCSQNENRRRVAQRKRKVLNGRISDDNE